MTGYDWNALERYADFLTLGYVAAFFILASALIARNSRIGRAMAAACLFTGLVFVYGIAWRVVPWLSASSWPGLVVRIALCLAITAGVLALVAQVGGWRNVPRYVWTNRPLWAGGTRANQR